MLDAENQQNLTDSESNLPNQHPAETIACTAAEQCLEPSTLLGLQIECQIASQGDVIIDSQQIQIMTALPSKVYDKSHSPVSDKTASNGNAADVAMPKVGLNCDEQVLNSQSQTSCFCDEKLDQQVSPTLNRQPAILTSASRNDKMIITNGEEPSLTFNTTENNEVPLPDHLLPVLDRKSATDDLLDGQRVLNEAAKSYFVDSEHVDCSSPKMTHCASKESNVTKLSSSRIVPELIDAYGPTKDGEDVSASLSYSEDFPSAVSSVNRTHSLNKQTSEMSTSKPPVYKTSSHSTLSGDKLYYSDLNRKSEESRETDEDISEDLNAEESSAESVSEVRLDLPAGWHGDSQLINMADSTIEKTMSLCDSQEQEQLKVELPFSPLDKTGIDVLGDHVPGTNLADGQPPSKDHADEHSSVTFSRKTLNDEIFQHFSRNSDQLSLSESVSGNTNDDLDQLISIAAAAVESFTSQHSGIDVKIVNSTTNNLLTDAINEMLLIRRQKRAYGVSVSPPKQLDSSKSGASDSFDFQVSDSDND
jgi:hypothetical protein